MILSRVGRSTSLFPAPTSGHLPAIGPRSCPEQLPSGRLWHPQTDRPRLLRVLPSVLPVLPSSRHRVGQAAGVLWGRLLDRIGRWWRPDGVLQTGRAGATGDEVWDRAPPAATGSAAVLRSPVPGPAGVTVGQPGKVRFPRPIRPPRVRDGLRGPPRINSRRSHIHH